MPPRKRYFPRKPLPAPEVGAPRERRDLEAVRDIVHASVSGESAEEALQFALDRIAPLLGAALGSVYVMDGASELMRLVAAHQWPERFRPWLGSMRVRVGFGPSGEAASERRVIDVPDVFADPDLEDWHDVGRELGFAAITALPLVAAGRVLGVATFYFQAASSVTSDARGLLRLVADLLASTADQAARRDALRRADSALTEANAEVERQYAAAGNARKARDDFLEGVSYDLRSPLSGLLASLSLLEQEVSGSLTAGQRDEVRSVRESAMQVLDLVEALLDFSGARRGTLELALDEFDPRVPMRDAVRDVGAPSAPVTVASVEPVLALPPMRGDRRKIVRLLVTLIEHVVEQSLSDRVEVTVDADASVVRYRVQEAGGRRSSLPDSVDDGSTPVGASLGDTAHLSWALELAQSVGQLMGGTVAADSVGMGRTAFTLELPLEGPPSAAPAHG
jgi:signal transduction histidine kinase